MSRAFKNQKSCQTEYISGSMNVNLHEKQLNILFRVPLLATFDTLQTPEQGYCRYSAQQGSHHHKRVLHKWNQQMVSHFWEADVGHILQTSWTLKVSFELC